MRTTRTKATTESRKPALQPEVEPAQPPGRGGHSPARWRFALGLGANLPRGERSAADTLQQTVRALAHHLGPLESASLYRSAPVSSQPTDTPQPDYYNTVVIGSTDLSPDALLAVSKAFEQAAGRQGDPSRRDAPRPLDVDLLLYGGGNHPDSSDNTHLEGPELTLPHPRLRERRFVLEPLAELLPDWPLPPDGRTIADLLSEVREQRVERCPWPPTTGETTEGEAAQ